ncbi:hypothetical protein [Desulfonatronum sp. SC1]|uniref:hypothetical protein n=1 Tax=Desulfonatronum sp. SC1 TaxID=2109626 RepID=UPI00130502BC|nr:hypothetical protein [Desulfonatronum sp. SC1]
MDGGVAVGVENLSPDGVAPNATHSEDTPAPTVSRGPRIPIIAVTAHTQPGEKERFLADGMVDYLGKPVSVDGLKRVLNKYMRCIP